MKHKPESYQEIANLMGQNLSFENYFSDDAISKIKNASGNEICSKASFVVEWQMEDDKEDFSIRFK